MRRVILPVRFSGMMLLVAALSACAPAHAEGLGLTGSVKSLFARSRSVTGEAFGLSLNRLRVEAKGDVAPGLALDLQYDNELLFGNYLDTGEFRATKDFAPPQYWRAKANYLDRGDAYGRHRFYRAAITAAAGNVDLRVGRQRIAWGTGRIWSPLDILNPINPLALERDERVGVDAVLVEAKLGPLARASLVYAPAPDRGPASRAAQWHGNAAGVDVSLVVGRLLGLEVLGMDLAGQIGPAGIRGEIARQRSSSGETFNRLVVGADYAFANGLTLSAEGYYNGAGARDPSSYDRSRLSAGHIASLATRYAGLIASYELTPLLKWVTYAVLNADDRSRVVDSRLVWSVRPDLELTVGAQGSGGGRNSEFGVTPAAWQGQAQWFF
jgi:hypothetical protein